jgi:hypothetical protein
LSAFCVERVAEIEICNDRGVIVILLLEGESCCNAVDQMELFGSFIWADDGKLENSGMSKLEELVEFGQTVG